MTILRRGISVAGLPLLNAWPAHACTVCDSRNGHALRAGLFNGHFVHTLLLVLSPVPIFAIAVALLHVAMPDLSHSTRRTAEDTLPSAELVA